MIRPIKASDKDIFLQLSKQFYSSTAVDHAVDPKNFALTFDLSLGGSPYTECVMVECDTNIVGFGMYSITHSNEAGGLSILLEELFITEEYRSRGLGKEFFEYVYTKFGNKAKRFRLEVTKVNYRAQKLYASLGYEVLEYVQMIKDID